MTIAFKSSMSVTFIRVLMLGFEYPTLEDILKWNYSLTSQTSQTTYAFLLILAPAIVLAFLFLSILVLLVDCRLCVSNGQTEGRMEGWMDWQMDRQFQTPKNACICSDYMKTITKVFMNAIIFWKKNCLQMVLTNSTSKIVKFHVISSKV